MTLTLNLVLSTPRAPLWERDLIATLGKNLNPNAYLQENLVGLVNNLPPRGGREMLTNAAKDRGWGWPHATGVGAQGHCGRHGRCADPARRLFGFIAFLPVARP